MNSRRFLALIALVASAGIVACGDDGVIPPPPPPPPQIPTVQSWTRGQGLPSNDVYSILVTSEGELWIGTEAGIGIYPSITSIDLDRVVNELNGLPNPKVRSMVEYAGRVYVATWGGGIAIFDMAGDSWSTRGTVNGLRAGTVADLAASPGEDRVYCATTNGVSIYNVTANTFSSFIPPNLLDPVVSAVDVRTVDATIERWYGPRYETIIPPGSQESLHGITVSRGASTVIKYTLANSAIAEARVNDIFCDSDPDVCWVAFTSSGAAVVDPVASTWTYHTTEDGLPSNLVYSLTRAADTMWAGTQGGLARLRGDGRWQGYDRGGGLQADRVRRVYTDNGERLWLGFVDGGAARVNPAGAE
ncbi:MAG TPA: two-component regulator propeller domain-containing protein [Candidatus Krumholzibacteria bacterium]|nr:two-component regulator propeller domain-containing protein [Candidatus Krumholzibacteria bacterium]